jgi:hypothetical protein
MPEVGTKDQQPVISGPVYAADLVSLLSIVEKFELYHERKRDDYGRSQNIIVLSVWPDRPDRSIDPVHRSD